VYTEEQLHKGFNSINHTERNISRDQCHIYLPQQHYTRITVSLKRNLFQLFQSVLREPTQSPAIQQYITGVRTHDGSPKHNSRGLSRPVTRVSVATIGLSLKLSWQCMLPCAVEHACLDVAAIDPPPKNSFELAVIIPIRNVSW
jgi:hypothetical protein